MGLASFNRMRRERAPVEKMEAERFKKNNEARWASHHGRDIEHDESTDPHALADLRQAELEASQRIGEKVRAGMRMGDDDQTVGGGVIDEPLRRDHAAEIAGRNLHDVQSPKDPVERIDERIPQGETANEQLVPHTQVDQPGPPAEMVDAAAVEAGAMKPEDATAAAEERARVEARLTGAARTKGGSAAKPAPATTKAERTAPAGETQGVGSTSDTGGGSAEGGGAAVDIPADWENLPWPQLRSLGSQFGTVHTREDAEALIRAELTRRGR